MEPTWHLFTYVTRLYQNCAESSTVFFHQFSISASLLASKCNLTIDSTQTCLHEFFSVSNSLHRKLVLHLKMASRIVGRRENYINKMWYISLMEELTPKCCHLVQCDNQRKLHSFWYLWYDLMVLDISSITVSLSCSLSNHMINQSFRDWSEVAMCRENHFWLDFTL